MKKVFASILALTMTAAMLTSCGDSDSSSKSESSSKKEETTTTTTAETTTTPAETEAPAESSEAPAESGTEEGEAPKDISEMPETLASYENASVYWKADTDIASIIEPFAEDQGSGVYVPNTDESEVAVSIEELEGIPMAKIEVLSKTEDGENWAIPKIKIHMENLFEGHEEDLEKIFTVKADVVTKAVGNFVSDDGTEMLVPGNFMGAFVTQPTDGNGGNSWNDLYDFGESEWVSEWGSYELTMRPGIKAGKATFVNSTDPQFVSIMRWSIPNQADFYIADLTFEDEDGNVIECPAFAK